MQTEIKNPYKGLRLEFHILQSFPVTCLNRDDVGSPKTAIIGGVTRARVSSQCWKRHVRSSMKDYGAKLGFRTKYIGRLLEEELLNLSVNPEKARELSQHIENVLNAKSKKTNNRTETQDSQEELNENEGKTDTMLFLSPGEIKKIAEQKEELINIDNIKKLEKVIGAGIDKNIDAIDIALFGRMVAKANKLDVPAAASFSHAISTHKVSNEIEFFTAVDDFQEKSDMGASHMGSLEFNSATYYRYINLDIGQLYETLKEDINIIEAIEKFIKALFVAVPMARQTTQAGYSSWEFARIYIRTGQPIQVPFETPVKAKNEDGGFLESSKEELKRYLDSKEKLYGSLFGCKGKFDFGEDENFSIDSLIETIKSSLQVNK